MSDVQIVGPGGVKATLHDDGSITYPAGAGPTGRRAMGGMPPLPASMRQSDEELDLPSSGPIRTDLVGVNSQQPRDSGAGGTTGTGGTTLPFLATPRQSDVTERKPHIQTELESDPLLQEGVGQAMTLPLLHAAAWLVSAAGRGLLGTRGGQAAKFLSEAGEPIRAPTKPFGQPATEFDPAVTVKGGDFGGMPAGRAVEQLEAMKGSRNLPKGTVDAIDAEIARIKGAAPMTADPEIARARAALEFHGPHVADMGMGGGAAAALLHAGHGGLAGIPALSLMAMRNIGPIAGRAALPTLRLGEALGAASPDLALSGSPLLQAAEGR